MSVQREQLIIDNKSNKTPLKIGLIGLGKMGQNHLRVLSMLKAIDLAFVYDISLEKMNNSVKVAEVPISYNLIDDLKKVDAVIIATPTSTHFDYIQLVSQYVSNIFVEKPLTDNLETSKQILELVEHKQLNIQVGFIERFNPVVIELKKILDHSNKVVNTDFVRTNKLSNRIQDVDVIIDLMIHDIDLALYLHGDITDIYAYGAIDQGLIAYACAVLTHKNGRFSRLTASRITEKRIRQINVTSEDMYIDCNLTRKEITINKQTIDQSYAHFSLASIEETVNVSMQESLSNELLAFAKWSYDDIKGVDIPDSHSAYKAMQIANAIQSQIWMKYDVNEKSTKRFMK